MKGEIIPWMQNRRGAPIDLVQPTPAMVDFRVIADTLAQIRRYAGNAEKPVSVALHTLIAFEAAEPCDKAHVLLHDAHEAHIGDIITPTAKALQVIAWTAGDETRTVQRAITALKAVHDRAIHEAAGLSLPRAEQSLRIRRADLVALQTERRDFLAESRRKWEEEVERVPPLRKRFRLRADPDVADELYSKFCHFLPALAAKVA